MSTNRREPAQWHPSPPPDAVLKGQRGADATREQDAAAGGGDRRKVDLGDGRVATASVSLHRKPDTRRVYAYLRYKVDSKTTRVYLGDVTQPDRATALRRGWQLARERKLVK